MLAAPGVIAWIVIVGLARSRISARLADVPNERSLHEVPTPRVGGIGIMVAAAPLAAGLGGRALAPALLCAAFLCIVSLADDIRSLLDQPGLGIVGMNNEVLGHGLRRAAGTARRLACIHRSAGAVTAWSEPYPMQRRE